MAKTRKPRNYGRLWTRQELILAFDLYCRIPFSKTKASNEQVRELAGVLERSPASVARKLGNFGALDPELHRRKISGLTHTGRLDREVWNEFHGNWNDLVVEAHRLRVSRGVVFDAAALDLPPKGPSERIGTAKQRLHQGFFRQAVLSSYESRCCITGIAVPECLVACHIIPWGEGARLRADPRNGLCLSATFHRLIDAGLITVSPDLRLCVAKSLRSSADVPTTRHCCRYHGKPILRPKRFLPLGQSLLWHRDNVFQG